MKKRKKKTQHNVARRLDREVKGRGETKQWETVKFNTSNKNLKCQFTSEKMSYHDCYVRVPYYTRSTRLFLVCQ